MLVTVDRGANLVLPTLELEPAVLSEQSGRQWIRGV